MREAEPFRPRRRRLVGTSPEPPVRPVFSPSDYPESDGKPMAETPVHWYATVDATYPLHWFFKQRSDVYVGSDMFVYYVEGDPRRSVVPDVWVSFGVPKLPERRSWLTWLEGKGPELGSNGRYRNLVFEERDGVLRHASLLGLELCLDGGRLFYFDPVRNVRLLTPSEERDGRHKEKEGRVTAEEALRAAEARIAVLERELRTTGPPLPWPTSRNPE